MPKKHNPNPPHPVTFGLHPAHLKRYKYDRAIAEQDGRKLPMAVWLNQCVSDALAARANDKADEAAVNVAVAELMNALPTQFGAPFERKEPFKLGDEVTIQSPIYAEKFGTVVQTASPDRNYLHPIGVELSGGRIEFFTVDGCDVTGARALYHKTTNHD